MEAHIVGLSRRKRHAHIKRSLKHNPCRGYWLLDTTACPLPVREVDADNNTRSFVHLPLFVYGEGLTAVCRRGATLQRRRTDGPGAW